MACVCREIPCRLHFAGGLKMLNSFFDKFIFTNNLKYRHHNFYLVKLPFLIVPTELITAISNENDMELNQKIYSVIKNSTRKKLIQQFTFDVKLSRGKVLNLVEEFFTASGWGEIKNIDIDPKGKRAIVVISNAPDSTSKNRPKISVHHFLRGILAGIFSNYFKTSVDCVETECIAEGKTSCKFTLKKNTDFDFSKKDTKVQLVKI